jgi:hypothetical protein
MAGLNPNYVVGINLGEVFVDKVTGLPLAGGKIYFYKDEARSVPKTVYELTGSPPNYLYEALPNPIILSAVGTIINTDGDNVAVYYYPYDSQGNIENYYIRVFSEDDVEQLERQAWPNLTPTSTPGGDGNAATVQNQLSNSQFVDVAFPTDTGLEISWTGALSETTYTIAPDWDLVIEASGTGSVTINRDALVGSLNVTTNPPFQLDIVASSVNITTLKLVQRLSNNPDIWAEQYVAGIMLVQSLDGISRTFSMVYAPSIAVAETTIAEGASGASGYTELKGSVLLPEGTNSDDSNDGYVDIEIILPLAGHYTITSLQLTSGTAEPTADDIIYQQDPVNRQRDFSFHHYRPQIIQLAVPSILQGWDFRVNPAQWGASQVLLSSASDYVWDQTIIFQDTNNAISLQRGTKDGFEVDIALASQFAVIQYIEGGSLSQLTSSYLSTLITAYTDIAGGARGTVSLWVTNDALPNIGAKLSIVASLDSQGKPATFNGNWTEIARTTGWDAQFTIPEASDFVSIPLEGWEKLSVQWTYGAIVVGFEETDPGAVVFEQISVTPTLIASPAAPLSFELTLNQLQRYWEKSYAPGTLPGTPTLENAIWVRSLNSSAGFGGGNLTVLYRSDFFFLPYKNTKRVPPNIDIHSTDGTEGFFQGVTIQSNTPDVTVNVQNIAQSNWFGLTSVNSVDGFFISASNTSSVLATATFALASSNGIIVFYRFHYALDSRLGIV